MSDAQVKPAVSGNVLVIALVVAFVAVIAACVVLAAALEESENPTGLIAMILAAFAGLVPGVGALVIIGQVKTKVVQVAQHTDAMVNGLMDSKIRAGIADTVDPAMIRADVRDQLGVDYGKRDVYGADHHGPATPPEYGPGQHRA